MPKTKSNPFSSRVKDLTGQKFGRLTVIKFSRINSPSTLWLCRCKCGKKKDVSRGNLMQGTVSCGCWRRERIRRANYFHGQSVRGNVSPEYRCWRGMIQRCFNKNSTGFANWGGRGITVCKKWRDSFSAFYADVGPRPGPGYSIDRIDNGKSYTKSNTRWATKKQQARNTKTNRVIKFQGEKLCITAWAEKYNIRADTLFHRLNQGWPVKRALQAPVRKHTQKRRKPNGKS